MQDKSVICLELRQTLAVGEEENYQLKYCNLPIEWTLGAAATVSTALVRERHLCLNTRMLSFPRAAPPWLLAWDVIDTQTHWWDTTEYRVADYCFTLHNPAAAAQSVVKK